MLLFGATSVNAHQNPAGCTGSGLGISLFVNAADVHIGEILTYSATVFNGQTVGPIVCDATGITASITTPDGVVHPITLVRTTLLNGQSDHYADVVTYMVRAQDLQSDGTLRAVARDDGDIHQNDTDSRGGAVQGVNTQVAQPCIQVTVQCTGGVGENGTLNFTGTVSNCGNTPLRNVTLTNFVNGGQFPVSFVTNLAVGASAPFSGSWIPSNPCVPSTATLVAQGTDLLLFSPRTVTNSASTTCSVVLTPGIQVTKLCPANPVAPGQPLIYSGSVSNTGNVTLTNIVVVDDHSGTAPIFTAPSLAPGAVANFTGSFTAPATCSVASTVTATANSRCGVAVSSTASATCPILTAPQISITASCPTNSAAPGGTVTYNGTVSNTGNIPLNNVVEVSDRPAPGTTIATIGSLAPGASANFTGSYVVPANVCSVTTTLIASGQDVCSTTAAANTAVITCPVVTTPHIAVTLVCPTTPAAPGGTVLYTGTVSNTGNVALNNVAVANSTFVTTTLAPGASANFTASFTAPTEGCSLTSTVTASGSDACAQAIVSNSASATCALVTSPHIAITQNCPDTSVGSGGTLVFTGTIRNSGDVTLTNVVVVNDHSGNTPIFTAASLAPGATANYTGSFTVSSNTCSITSSSTVRATSVCGVAVSDTTSATCPILTAAQVRIAAACPTNNVGPGGTVTYTGSVRNSGNITLNNVVVMSDQPAANTIVSTIASLAPGTSANFSGSYVVPANACSVTTTLKVTAQDSCSTAGSTDSTVITCPVVTTPRIAVSLNCPTTPSATGGTVIYTGTVSNPGNVTLHNVTVSNAAFVATDLAPGAAANFTATFTASVEACSLTGTVTASGTDACSQAVVSNSASATCALVTSPALALTQNCPVAPASPGSTATFTGSVRNTGNITLSNIVVSSSQTAIDTGGGGAPSTVGLVGYWNLDEASGNVAGDSSGLGNTGTIVNATHVTGAVGNGLLFNGVNTSVIITNKASLNFSGQITLSAWVKPLSTAGKQNILAHGYTTQPDQRASVFLRVNEGRYEVGSWNGVTEPIAAATIPSGDIGSFVHLTGVYNGTSWIIYRNGVAMNTATGMGALTVDADWTIGARDDGADRFFNGVIDDVRIYNRGLSSAEVAALSGLGGGTTPPSTPFFTVATLAPGAAADFTVSYPVPASGACSITSTLSAAGHDLCTGSQVTATTSSTCPLVTSPDIEVSQTCPTTPVKPGDVLTYTGTVKNIGNITLTDVKVFNDRSGDAAIFTVASLAPGATANFTGHYTTHSDCCVDSSTVTATGHDSCTSAVVTDTFTRTCPMATAPKIVVTKVCPTKTLEPGDVLKYTGTVSNAGNITLTNVIVTSTQPSPGTVVLGPIVLVAGESVHYTASFTIGADFCGTDTVTARGLDVCTQAAVENSVTSTCPILTSPQIAVVKNCPAVPTSPGGTYSFTGTVSNPGNVTLVNVYVVEDQPAANTPVLGPITLAPGASAPFSGSFIAPANCCFTTDTVTAKGQNICSDEIVVATSSSICPLLSTPRIAVAKNCPAVTPPIGGLYTFSGSVTNIGRHRVNERNGVQQPGG